MKRLSTGTKWGDSHNYVNEGKRSIVEERYEDCITREHILHVWWKIERTLHSIVI